MTHRPRTTPTKRRTTVNTDLGAAESVIQRVFLAVRQLAIGKGDVRDRLQVAGLTLVPLQAREFPASLQESFDSIMADLTKYDPQFHEGRIEATMKRIQNATGQRIAMRIFELYSKLQEIRGFPML